MLRCNVSRYQKNSQKISFPVRSCFGRGGDLEDIASIHTVVLIMSECSGMMALGITSFLGLELAKWEYIVGSGFLITILIFGIFIMIEKYPIKGWGAGAVKG